MARRHGAARRHELSAGAGWAHGGAGAQALMKFCSVVAAVLSWAVVQCGLPPFLETHSLQASVARNVGIRRTKSCIALFILKHSMTYVGASNRNWIDSTL